MVSPLSGPQTRPAAIHRSTPTAHPPSPPSHTHVCERHSLVDARPDSHGVVRVRGDELAGRPREIGEALPREAPDNVLVGAERLGPRLLENKHPQLALCGGGKRAVNASRFTAQSTLTKPC